MGVQATTWHQAAVDHYRQRITTVMMGDAEHLQQLHSISLSLSGQQMWSNIILLLLLEEMLQHITNLQ